MTLAEQERLEGEKRSERLSSGEVIEIDLEQARSSDKYVYWRRQVSAADISDHYIERGMRMLADYLNDEAIDHPDWQPPRKVQEDSGTKVELLNDGSRRFYLDDLESSTETSLLKWAKAMPSARALYPIYRPDDAGRFIEDGGDVDRKAYETFITLPDCIDIRSRASIMGCSLEEVAAESPNDEIVVASLGSGAAVPIIDAAVAIREKYGKSVNMHLFDLMREPLGDAGTLSSEAGIPSSNVKCKRGDFTKAFKDPELPKGSLDVVESLGLFEYLSDEKCRVLLSEGYKLLKPGGRLIVANMLESRPQLEFNQQVVGWPSLQIRSIDHLVALVADAGIDTELLTITETNNGIYAVMEIRKPK